MKNGIKEATASSFCYVKHQPAGGKREGGERGRDFMRQKLMNQPGQVRHLGPWGTLLTLLSEKKKPKQHLSSFLYPQSTRWQRLACPREIAFLISSLNIFKERVPFSI